MIKSDYDEYLSISFCLPDVDLALPLVDERQRRDQQEGSADLGLRHVPELVQESDRLDGLAEPHFIRQHAGSVM